MLAINLVGTPWINREGSAWAGPRGRRTWRLLT